MLQQGGPGLIFENVKGRPSCAVNLLGTLERICWAMNMQQPQELETLGKSSVCCNSPPPKKISEAVEFGRVLFDVLKLNQGVTFPRLPKW